MMPLYFDYDNVTIRCKTLEEVTHALASYGIPDTVTIGTKEMPWQDCEHKDEWLRQTRIAASKKLHEWAERHHFFFVARTHGQQTSQTVSMEALTELLLENLNGSV